jgi:hypothetical protein
MRDTLVSVIGFVVLFLLALIWPLFMGWLLTLILPFTLFEGALLAMLATGVVMFGLNMAPSEIPSPADPFEDADHYMISVERFMPTPEDRNWENWIRYNIANAVCYDFEHELDHDWTEEEERDSKAIQVSDAIVALLKRKSPRSPRNISKSQLTRQLEKMDVELDDKTMRVALEAVNDIIGVPYVSMAVEENLWQEPFPSRVRPLT